MPTSISEFFEKTLTARFRNFRSSWGSYDDVNNRIFLRLWVDNQLKDETGEWIEVLYENHSDKFGQRERARHVEMIRNGAPAYGVLCAREIPLEGKASSIRSFDAENLLILGRLEAKKTRRIYAHIDQRIPVETLQSTRSGWSKTAEDLNQIQSGNGDTTRQTLVEARLGQGKYRYQVLDKWNDLCAVTGCDVREILRASHVKPWSHSSNDERLDPDNGLSLVATLDALFDAGLISFSINGEMLVSHQIKEKQAQFLGIPLRLRQSPNRKLQEYLKYHERHIFRKN